MWINHKNIYFKGGFVDYDKQKEAGVSLVQIKVLLGHSCIRSTMTYIHVSNNIMLKNYNFWKYRNSLIQDIMVIKTLLSKKTSTHNKKKPHTKHNIIILTKMKCE